MNILRNAYILIIFRILYEITCCPYYMAESIDQEKFLTELTSNIRNCTLKHDVSW